MKRFIKLFSIAALGLGIHAAQADVHLMMQNYATQADSCSGLIGHWAGEGSAKNTYFTCKYNGTADVTGSGASYTFDINLSGKAGNFILCPATDSFQLVANCSNGNLSLNSTRMNLNGTTDGHTASFAGNVYYPFEGYVKVDMKHS